VLPNIVDKVLYLLYLVLRRMMWSWYTGRWWCYCHFSW